jgi:hypothetical protein
VHLSRAAAIQAAASAFTASPLHTLPVLVVGNKVDAAVADAQRMSIWRAVLQCLVAPICGPCLRGRARGPAPSPTRPPTTLAASGRGRAGPMAASAPTATGASPRFCASPTAPTTAFDAAPGSAFEFIASSAPPSAPSIPVAVAVTTTGASDPDQHADVAIAKLLQRFQVMRDFGLPSMFVVRVLHSKTNKHKVDTTRAFCVFK